MPLFVCQLISDKVSFCAKTLGNDDLTEVLCNNNDIIVDLFGYYPTVSLGKVARGSESYANRHLKKSYRQALSAGLAIRSRMAEEGAIIHYKEAGIFQFMPELLGSDAAKEYVDLSGFQTSQYIWRSFY